MQSSTKSYEAVSSNIIEYKARQGNIEHYKLTKYYKVIQVSTTKMQSNTK